MRVMVFLPLVDSLVGLPPTRVLACRISLPPPSLFATLPCFALSSIPSSVSSTISHTNIDYYLDPPTDYLDPPKP